MSSSVIGQLHARGRALAQAAAAKVRARVARRWGEQWTGRGTVIVDDETLRLQAPGLHRQRRGTRTRLADPNLLWPGDR